MAFRLPYSLQSLPKTKSDDYSRPSDWPVITDAANEVQALVNDQGAGYISFNTSFTAGTMSIDWGDGSPAVALTSNVPATKYYTAGTGATCSRGYTTFKVRIYGSGSITACRPTYQAATSANGSTLGTLYSVGILEMYYGDGVAPGGAGSYFSSNGQPNSIYSFNQLEYVKFPTTVTTIGLTFMFSGCVALQKVVLPNHSISIVLTSTFAGCHSLRTIEFPASFTIASMNSTFANCYSLKSVTFSPTNLISCSNMSSAFSGCQNLVTIDLPPFSGNLLTTLTSAFTNCVNLQSIRFQGLNSTGVPGGTITATSLFQNCYSLENITWPASGFNNDGWTAGSMFLNCFSLKDIIFPSWFPAPYVFTSGCSGCNSLQKFAVLSGKIGTTAGIASDWSSAFLNCQNLVEVNLPPTITSPTFVAANMFQNCITLGSLSLNWTQITNASTMFSGCSNIRTISLPNATAITNITNMFASCFGLTSLTLPSTLNSVTTASGVFSSCHSLQFISLPSLNYTAASGAGLWATMFQNCYELQAVTFSSTGTGTVTSTLAFTNMFQNCHSLQNINLSSFSTLSIIPNTASSDPLGLMFQGCSSLRSVNLANNLKITGTNFNPANLAAFLTNAQALESIDVSFLGATTSQYYTWNNNVNGNNISGLTFSCQFAKFTNNGGVSTRKNLQTLRLLNTAAGQYGGTSPQIDVSYTSMTTAALAQLFVDLPTVTTKTINITGASGAAGLSAGQRAVATGKGWTITG